MQAPRRSGCRRKEEVMLSVLADMVLRHVSATKTTDPNPGIPERPRDPPNPPTRPGGRRVAQPGRLTGLSPPADDTPLTVWTEIAWRHIRGRENRR